MFSGGIEVEHWLKIGYVLNVLHINFKQIQDNIQLINTVLLLRNLNMYLDSRKIGIYDICSRLLIEKTKRPLKFLLCFRLACFCK